MNLSTDLMVSIAIGIACLWLVSFKHQIDMWVKFRLDKENLSGLLDFLLSFVLLNSVLLFISIYFMVLFTKGTDGVSQLMTQYDKSIIVDSVKVLFNMLKENLF